MRPWSTSWLHQVAAVFQCQSPWPGGRAALHSIVAEGSSSRLLGTGSLASHHHQVVTISTTAAASPSKSRKAPRRATSKLLSSTVTIVLLQDVMGLGRRGDVKVANPGWVRHKLFPRGAALYATPENVAKYAQSQEERAQSMDPHLALEKEVLRMLRTLAHRVVAISRKAVPASSSGSSAAATAEAAEVGSRAMASAAPGSGEPGYVKMRGSVTPYDVMQAVLRQTGIQLHESHLLLNTSLTSFGNYKIPLNFRMLDGHQVELNLEVNAVKELKHGRWST